MAKLKIPNGSAYFAIILILFGCGKDREVSFVFTGEAPPLAPIIMTPTTDSSYIVYRPNVRITGCFTPACLPMSKMQITASGTGDLTNTNSGFSFEATMAAGETRLFSFNSVNAKGDVSPSSTLSIFYDASTQLLPLATLFNGGSSGSNKVSNGLTLNFLTSLPSLSEASVTVNGFTLTSGALNPQ